MYLDAGDGASTEVVLNRLERLNHRLHLDDQDDVMNQCIRAALLLCNGSHEQALELAEQMRPARQNDFRPHWLSIWINTIVTSLSHLGRHQDVIETWDELATLPTTIAPPSTLLTVAASYEAIGRFEEAYKLEFEANTIRGRQNLALPSLISITQDVAAALSAESGQLNRMAAEDYTTLWARTSELVMLIDELRETVSALLDSVPNGDRSLESTVESQLEMIEHSVMAFDSEPPSNALETTGTKT